MRKQIREQILRYLAEIDWEEWGNDDKYECKTNYYIMRMII